MRVQHIWSSLAALLLVGAVAGCSSSTPPQSQATPAASETAAPGGSQPSGGYPAPGDSAYPAPTVNSAYPAPTVAMPVGREPEPIPQPAAGMGVVHGMVYNQTTDAPIYDGVTVYLSKVIGTDAATMDAVSVDTTNDPSVTPDREGGFAFADVPPGRYGIVVQGPLNQYLARFSDDQGKDVTLTVEAGQTVDLGKIYSGYP